MYLVAVYRQALEFRGALWKKGVMHSFGECSGSPLWPGSILGGRGRL